MLSCNHHRHTFKATLHGRQVLRRKQKLSDFSEYSTHARRNNSTKTLHANSKVSQSFLCHSRHCGLCTRINKPHQTFRETNRSYRLATSTHSTGLNCSASLRDFSQFLPVSADLQSGPSLIEQRADTSEHWSAAKGRKWIGFMSKSVPCPILRCPSYMCTVWHVGTKNTTSYTLWKILRLTEIPL